MRKLYLCWVLTSSILLQGCTVVRVVDAAASTTIGVAKGTVKATSKVVSAAIPDGNDEKKEDKKKNKGKDDN